MASPKPCLGFPSRTEAIFALRGDGLSTRQIAERIGIEVKTVGALECSAARKDRRPDPRSTAYRSIATNANNTRIAVDIETLRKLRPHAARRGVSAEFLAGQLLLTLADDALVDALLDDADELR